MQFRHNLATVSALLVSLLSIQSACFAGAASRGISLQGKVRFFGSRHFLLKQPAPVQAAPTVNVRDFGATGNGVTDDTPFIQNAINSARASGQGVFFPAGTYLHNGIITAQSVNLIGVGGGTTLLANNPTATAVILTGAGPSIQNMIVSSALAGNGFQDLFPPHATLLVQNAQNFVVQGITIVQATGRAGIYLQQSAVGSVSSVTMNGTGSPLDWGILMDGCNNVSLLSNLILNEARAMNIGGLPGGFVPQSIAIQGNSINTPNGDGVVVTNINGFDVENNQIQLGATGTSIAILNAISCVIANNVSSGGSAGMFLQSSNPAASAVISNNIIRNCQSEAISLSSNLTTPNVFQCIGNQFGECGISNPASVIEVGGAIGSDTVVLVNNVYAGHTNALQFFIQSTHHLNTVNGNYQIQTVLGNSIP